MKTHDTEQERFWAGQFGSEYISRNEVGSGLPGTIEMFSGILPRVSGARSAVEFGANIGINLEALHALNPELELSAIEINADAVARLERLAYLKHVYHESILQWTCDYPRDLVLVKGVLIHVNPDRLPAVYSLLHESSRKYICLVEYYNPVPVEVAYRGHSGKLFKRDFAGEMLDHFPDLRLVDYGFRYHRDPSFPQDDLTWFLLEKTAG